MKAISLAGLLLPKPFFLNDESSTNLRAVDFQLQIVIDELLVRRVEPEPTGSELSGGNSVFVDLSNGSTARDEHLGIETLQVLMAFLAAGELTYAFKLGFLRHGVSCWTLHAAEENCASAKSSNSTARIMRLKKPFIFAVLMLLWAEAQFSSAACDVQQLTPCLSALTSNTNPSQLCCQRLNQQKPCFCQYLKNSSLKMYLNSPAAKKAAKTCNVSIPKC
nr:non-specific lipid-transfer protein 2-like [Ipomoea batatas]